MELVTDAAGNPAPRLGEVESDRQPITGLVTAIEAVLREERGEQRGIGDGAFHKGGGVGHLVAEPTGQIVEHHGVVAQAHAFRRNVAADKTGASGDQRAGFPIQFMT